MQGMGHAVKNGASDGVKNAGAGVKNGAGVKKPVNLRIDGVLWARAKRHAGSRGCSLTQVVEEALQAYLCLEPDDQPLAVEQEAVGGVPSGAGVSPEPPAERPAYRCPMVGCDFAVPSAKARCPVHGRTVRPA